MDTDHDKIIRVEEKIGALSSVVYEIKDNHLAHLSADVKELVNSVGNLNIKLATWSGGIVVILWLLEKFLK